MVLKALVYKVIHEEVKNVPTDSLEPTGVTTFAQRRFHMSIIAPSLQGLMSFTK